MDAELHAQQKERSHIADICAALLVLLALLVLSGWALQIQALCSFSPYPSQSPMPVNAALGLMLLGMAVFALNYDHPPLLWLSTATCSLLAVAILFQHQTGTDLKIDELFFSDNWSPQNPGRMTAANAIMLLFSTILLLFHKCLLPRFSTIFDALVMVYAICVFTVLLIYLTDASTAEGSQFLFSLPATLGFLLFCMGLMVVTPTGLTKFARQHHGGKFRRHSIILLGLCIAINFAVNDLSGLSTPASVYSHALLSSVLTGACIYMLGLNLFQNAQAPSEAVEPATEKPESYDYKTAVLRILNSCDDAMLLVNKRRDIVCANKGTSRIFGWSMDELRSMKLEALVPKRFQPVDIGIYHQFTLSNERSLRFGEQARSLGLSKKGVEKPISISLYKCERLSEEGDIELIQEENADAHWLGECSIELAAAQEMYTLIFIRELSGLEAAMAEAHQKSAIDHITGLPNYEDFSRYCAEFKNQSIRKDDKYISLLFIDLDSFKVINEKFGRDFGDRVLMNIATTLKSRLRSSDKLFRYEADEFLLISESHSEDQADLMAERIRTSVKVSPTKMNDTNVYLTCSIALCSAESSRFDLKEKAEHLRTKIHNRSISQKDCVINVPWQE